MDSVGTGSVWVVGSATGGWYRWRSDPSSRVGIGQTLAMTSSELGFPEPAQRERAETVLRQAFIAAQIGMPSEDRETAVETLWIILESLLVDHLAPDAEVLEDRADRRTTLGTHWRRMVTTAVTNTFILGGVFVMPDELLRATEERATQHLSGSLWHTRRPPGPGALVLAVHRALEVLDGTASRGEFAGKADAEALVDLIAFATLGATLAGGEESITATGTGAPTDRRTGGRRTRDAGSTAAAFGIPGVQLVEVHREGWACDACGCVFMGRVEGGVAYPDRMAPIGRGGPCDLVIDCACHGAPVQRDVR